MVVWSVWLWVPTMPLRARKVARQKSSLNWWKASKARFFKFKVRKPGAEELRFLHFRTRANDFHHGLRKIVWFIRDVLMIAAHGLVLRIVVFKVGSWHRRRVYVCNLLAKVGYTEGPWTSVVFHRNLVKKTQASFFSNLQLRLFYKNLVQGSMLRRPVGCGLDNLGGIYWYTYIYISVSVCIYIYIIIYIYIYVCVCECALWNIYICIFVYVLLYLSALPTHDAKRAFGTRFQDAALPHMSTCISLASKKQLPAAFYQFPISICYAFPGRHTTTIHVYLHFLCLIESI